MTANLAFFKEKFAEFNRQIFAGRLPEPALTICDATSFVGQCRYDGKNFELRLSNAFDFSERQWEDVVIHEMIHYFLAYNGLIDSAPHGPLFKALMKSINEVHAREITVSRRSRPGEITNPKKKWHVIAILHFTSGELGVKVLPRVLSKVLDYHSTTLAAPNISSIDLYLHNDPFFNRFPSSVARRCHLISPEDKAAHLKGAHILRVEGKNLIQT